MAICEHLIKSDVVANCSNPIFAGLEPLGYIMNRADIDSFTEADGVVSTITLKTGKKAYHIQQMGSQPFNGTNTEMQSGDFMNTFNKVASFIILDNGSKVSTDIIDPMSNGEFVIVLENKYKNATGEAFEVVGLDRGARATAITRNMYENNAGWQCELTESEVSNSAKFFFNTDAATTRAALEALCA